MKSGVNLCNYPQHAAQVPSYREDLGGIPEPQESWEENLGLEKKSSSTLSLRSAGFHARSPPHLVPKHTHLHVFTSIHSRPRTHSLTK